MASIQPTGSTSETPSISYLIVDSSPLLTSPISSLRGIASNYLLTPEVVSELRDKNGRSVIEEGKLQLAEGFIIREPTLLAVSQVTNFARKTGDIAVLSTADIKVLALCLTLELEQNPKKLETELKEVIKVEEVVIIKRVEGGERKGAWGMPPPPSAPTPALILEEIIASTSTLPLGPIVEPIIEPVVVKPELEVVEEAEPEEVIGSDEEEDSDEESEAGSDDSHDSSSSWITPDNLLAQKQKDLNLFSAPNPTATKPKELIKVAVLTGDFAMQNVGLQMGLNVIGSGGKRVTQVRTWILRCHGCFKLCKNPEKRFCPSCGGPTLLRTSITYTPPTAKNPLGYILHLKKNFQYRLRGTRYSIPKPKMGKAGGGVNAEQVLREDQKEWIRGIKTVDHLREKESRSILRSILSEKEREISGLAPRGKTGSIGGIGGWGDPDWVPQMNLGETKGRRKGGKNGAGGEVKLDKSGLPLIGSGKKNVNSSRKRH